MKKLDRLLAKLLAVSVILFAVSFVFSNKEKNAPKSVQSAILNQKHKDKVSGIEIVKNNGQGSDKITLKRQGNFWLLTARDKTNGRELRVTAEEKIITSFLENSTRLRTMYIISDRPSEYNSFAVGENDGTVVSFLSDSGTVYTKIHFGLINSLKNRIYLRSENMPTVWECENDLQHYLTTDSSYWAAGELLPEIKNPVSLSFTKSGETFSFDETSEGFSAKVSAVLALRHGVVRSEESLTGAERADRTKLFIPNTIVATLGVQDGNGRLARIEFFEARNANAKEDEKSYFYIKSVTPSEIDSQETRFALYAEHAAYEISSWTFVRMQDFLLSK